MKAYKKDTKTCIQMLQQNGIDSMIDHLNFAKRWDLPADPDCRELKECDLKLALLWERQCNKIGWLKN